MKRLISLIMLFALAGMAIADDCITSGYVFFHNGSAVPAGTPVRLTNLNRAGADYNITTINFMGASNYYLQVVFCVQAAADTVNVYSAVSPWNRTIQYSSQGGVSQYRVNLTYNNIPPFWNATLPNQAMDEDNITGITHAFDAANYVFDYDSQPITFSFLSQSNPALVNASLDGSFVNISRTAANSSGTSTVCLRAYDTEDYSNSCFTVTVNAVPDVPSFTNAVDNFSGGIISNNAGIYVSSTAFDGDGQQVRLYVCNSTAVTAAGCTNTQYCTGLAASNPGCLITAPSDERNHTWHAFIYDVGGSQAAGTFNDSFTTDTFAPSAGTATLGTGPYSDTTSVYLNWSGFSDSMSGIRYYYYSTSNGQQTRTGTQTDNATSSVLLALPQGTTSLYVWAEDWVGHIGLAAMDTIIVDSLAPVISNVDPEPDDVDDAFSGPFIVTATVTDTTLQGLPQYRYRFGAGAFSAWQNMTNLSGTFQMSVTGNWSGLPDTWMYYELQATDYFNRTTVSQHSEFIDKTGSPPSFVGLSNLVAQEDSLLSFTLLAQDPNDEDILNFSASCCFSMTRINNRSVTASWTPGDDHVGQRMVTFNVTDGSYVVNATISVNVLPTNDAPLIDYVADLTGYIYQPFSALFTAIDPDNNNTYALDDQMVSFSTAPSLSWFPLLSYANASSTNHYATVNFTPVSSHTGYNFLTLVASDGLLNDTENFTLYIGFCGDTDVAGEPRCDSDYETCSSCPADCGECGSTTTLGSRMTIIINPRNCLNESFTMRTYELWGRATCEEMGQIVEGYEVCGNLTDVGITVYRLEAGKWTEIEEYETDDNGEATFVPNLEGEYKLIGEKKGYPSATKYLEIRDCLKDAIEEEEKQEDSTPPEKPPVKEKPEKDDDDTEVIDEVSGWNVLAVIGIPAMLAVFAVLLYYLYDRFKDDVAWLIKARIFLHTQKKRIVAEANKLVDKVKIYLGYK